MALRVFSGAHTNLFRDCAVEPIVLSLYGCDETMRLLCLSADLCGYDAVVAVAAVRPTSLTIDGAAVFAPTGLGRGGRMVAMRFR